MLVYGSEELNKKFPNRDYKATVSDINGRAVFIPRFLRPLPLPPLVRGRQVTIDETTTSITGGTDNQIQCVNTYKFSLKSIIEYILLNIFSNVWLVLFH